MVIPKPKEAFKSSKKIARDMQDTEKSPELDGKQKRVKRKLQIIRNYD